FWCSATCGQSHLYGSGGVDCRPTRGLADGEETAHALDPARCPDVCSTPAAPYSTGNSANILGGCPREHPPWRQHEPPRFFPVPILLQYGGSSPGFSAANGPSDRNSGI